MIIRSTQNFGAAAPKQAVLDLLDDTAGRLNKIAGAISAKARIVAGDVGAKAVADITAVKATIQTLTTQRASVAMGTLSPEAWIAVAAPAAATLKASAEAVGEPDIAGAADSIVTDLPGDLDSALHGTSPWLIAAGLGAAAALFYLLKKGR